MISKLHIENYRSIINAEINLKPLTVIVGPNASGKSNLIKAIDFISDFAAFGLDAALTKRGGFSEIIPKTKKNNKGVTTNISLEYTFDPPKNWNLYQLPDLRVFYSISFKNVGKRIEIENEELTLYEPLILAEFFKEGLLADLPETNNNSIPVFESIQGSQITFYKKSRGRQIDFKINFDLNERNVDLLNHWSGIQHFLIDPNPPRLKNLILYAINNIKDKKDARHIPILTDERSIEMFCVHFRKSLSALSTFRKYDLLISELRDEQNVSPSSQVNTKGSNLPSIAKKIFTKDKEGWQRIIRTMSNISPYFENVNSSMLRAGKEYLVFNEIFHERGIESWESSDGTLRALAILMALETHPPYSTVMIEEPEHGLHPWAIKEIINHIREIIVEKNMQVFLTTHSPQVLENIESDELLIAERAENGTTFSTIEEILPGNKISMGEVGALWVKGLLKGVPTY